jgi:hypothetical protein
MEEYQRRTQKGIGRKEKTGHNGAAKNPRSLEACNTTAKRDMGEFFFISMSLEFCETQSYVNFTFPAIPTGSPC